MYLKHKLLKDIGNKLYIDVPTINKQLKDTFIIILSIFVIIVVLYFMRIHESGSRIPYEGIFLGLFIILIFGVYVFGFGKRYIFDLNNKDVKLEGSNLFIPYSKTICPFNKIETFGIKCKKERKGTKHNGGKPSYYYVYYLVFSTKDKPLDFIELVSTVNIVIELSLNDLNEIGNSLSDILKCSFVEGQEYMTISKVNNEFKNVMINR